MLLQSFLVLHKLNFLSIATERKLRVLYLENRVVTESYYFAQTLSTLSKHIAGKLRLATTPLLVFRLREEYFQVNQREYFEETLNIDFLNLIKY